MATKEEISMTGFAIVAYAGDAKTDLIEALNEARKGNFEHARSLVKEARQSIDDAHNEQTKLNCLVKRQAARIWMLLSSWFMAKIR